MFDAIEIYLKDKIANKNASFWAKVVGGLAFLGLGIFLFVRYSIIKDSLTKAELEHILVDDNKQDSITKAKIKDIETARKSALEKANQHQANANKIESSIKVIDNKAKSEKDLINGITSWDDLDKIVKD